MFGPLFKMLDPLFKFSFYFSLALQTDIQEIFLLLRFNFHSVVFLREVEDLFFYLSHKIIKFI
jgi:hypothetical protein